MSWDWTLFWLTGGATLVGSVPAVIAGLYFGLALDRWRQNRRSLAQWRAAFEVMRAPGGMLYSTRDWGRATEHAALSAAPIGTSPLQPHSTFSLTWFLESGRLPMAYEPEFQSMIDLSSRLHLVIDKHLGEPLPAEFTAVVADDARQIADTAAALLLRMNEDFARTIKLRRGWAPALMK